MSKKKRNQIVTMLILSSALLIIAGITILFKNYKKNSNVCIGKETYTIVDLEIDFNSEQISYTFLDDNQKFLTDKLSSSKLLNIIYLSDDENNYIMVEKWGKNNNINKYKPIKLFINIETYKAFYNAFDWQEKSNINF